MFVYVVQPLIIHLQEYKQHLLCEVFYVRGMHAIESQGFIYYALLYHHTHYFAICQHLKIQLLNVRKAERAFVCISLLCISSPVF